RRGRAGRPRREPRRLALRRAAQPRQPRRRPARHAGAAGARRADRRARPAPARRAVGPVPPARPGRRHTAGVQPRHGRSGALRPSPAHARRRPPRRRRTPRAAAAHRGRRPRAGVPPPREGRVMNPTLTFATTRRILTQLRHDPRTVVMLILLPTLLMVLLRYVFNSTLVFSHLAPALLGLFPFLIMFLIASITTLRERTTATLERLMTLPIGRLDLLFGYALAFGSIAVVQVALAAGVSVWWRGLDLAGAVV